jgi:o-succinylbenzoate synthase
MLSLPLSSCRGRIHPQLVEASSRRVAWDVQYRFAFRRYAFAFKQPVRTAHGLWATREGVIVRLSAAGGTAAFGEAAPIPWFGTENVEEIVAACTSAGDVIDDAWIDAVPRTLGCLRFALQSARADIRNSGTCMGQGTDDSPSNAVPAAQVRYLAVSALLPAGRTALARIDTLLEGGFRNFKWKVGVEDAADEWALLDDLLARLPSGAKLRLDANGAWDRRRAERWFDRCAERPIEFVEQPIAPGVRGAEDLLLGLAGDYPTPIALDESLANTDHVIGWFNRGWPGLYVIKPAFLSESDETLRKLPRGKVVYSSALETAVGARAALRLAFRYEAERAIGFGVWPLFQDYRADGPTLAPFIRREDVERLNLESVWNALS